MSRFVRRGRSRGQALAEFAIVFPIFALLLFGIVDLGRYVFIANQLGNAAREAARAVAVKISPPDCSGMGREQCALQVAINRSQGILIKQPLLDADISCVRYGRVDGNGDGEYDISQTINDVGNCRPNDVLRVTIKHDFFLLTPLVSQFVGNKLIVGDAKVTVVS